ncbi:ATP-dependent DNA helicase RecG [Anaerobacterium chartisolvens]|uniref:ATP-dependent DNA helicase RecG n=1 Tax=Anaerobacterium chartisolvens TaxID=1297424 RepID=A0A369B9H2_9FIRM|nr:ATP-dependent DNA helicase RecG [Anaerobacterium chartisolvens]RCX17238.1 ATP-dependent DNA helicase RecG [Anaerobacterium chartisolvens]
MKNGCIENEAETILKKSIKNIKGVGESRARLFSKLNVYTIEDAITHYPREYEDRARLKKIAELEDGETCSVKGIIMSRVSESHVRRGLSLYKAVIKDETGTITGVWYNQSYIKRVFETGSEYVFFGTVRKNYRSLEIHNPVYDKTGCDDMKNTCRIVPVYPSTSALAQNTIRTVVDNALKLVEGRLEDIIPNALRERYKLSEINYSIKNIHFPATEQDFKNARYRLVFEELLLLQIGLLSIKSSFEAHKKGIEFCKEAGIQRFIDGLPFRLTDAQQRVLCEVEKDMESCFVMNRLIQGDVGSGKTIIAVLALLKAVNSGYQGAFMVPTEILAEQHFDSLKSFFEMSGVRVDILTGSRTKKQKSKILENIKEGNTDILIGTHALIEENVEFQKLGLVITDEQHRFGVRQRAILSRKGSSPDVLVMTATPIPRTLALILYGDLDISVIDQLPPERKPIKTYCVDNGMRGRINEFIRKKVMEGRQVYIVCPLVEDSDTVNAESASGLAERIAKKDFNDLSVGLIHGRMRSKEKEDVMRRFVQGEISILVSTTVIEVGVNVPNATVMVVENAEMFGLAQLHQLRGRVGRGACQSYCVLYNNGKSQVADERMKIMASSNDGFLISEKDLELRGPGEFFGTRQHGIPDLKIANLYRDMDILRLAQQAAFALLKEDRLLSSHQNAGLKQKVMERFRDKADELSLN